MQKKAERKIWFRQESTCWEEALPIGNGRLGAMVYGGVATEKLQLNEDSIWYGSPRNRINPEARANLDQVRSLILGERPDEAEELLRYTFSATPQSERIYQPLADCEIRMKRAVRAEACDAADCVNGLNWEDVTDYERSLDLNDAIVRVTYATPHGKIRREIFSSAERGVIVVHMEAEGEERLSFDVLMTREKISDVILMDQNDRVFMTGNLGKGGLDFAACCKVTADGTEAAGHLSAYELLTSKDCVCSRIGEHLVVRNAKIATIYLVGTSTFYEPELLPALNRTLDEAAAVPYEELKAEHIAEYQELFGRVELTLPTDAERQNLSTPERLAKVRAGESDPDLFSLYFDFGRYLLISSSRPGSLPANLQGIWNHRMLPPWDSKYTLNINLEMNYWPAENCALQECMEPVFDHLLRMRERGCRTAQEMYGCRGFLAHHNTDIWADTAPQDIYIPSTYWTQGGAWMSLFLWRHFEYDQDKAWLEKYFPVLEDAVLFYLDFLVEDQGEYVTCPSVSPENTYIMKNGTTARVCAGPAMDNELLTDLFRAYLEACHVLGKTEYARAAEEILQKLPPIKIGKHGQIMEWREDYDEADPGHRHISQLYALYPSNQITVDETPELAEAARKTLARRLQYGGGYTGWSAAWIINLYAQLGMGEEALHMLTHLFTQSTFDNLMDSHPRVFGPVFQIDGNLGGSDAITQMILQDNGKRIRLLPACPADWHTGKLTGLRLRGNAAADISWDDTTVTAAIHAHSDWDKMILCESHKEHCILKAGETKIYTFCL